MAFSFRASWWFFGRLFRKKSHSDERHEGKQAARRTNQLRRCAPVQTHWKRLGEPLAFDYEQIVQKASLAGAATKR